jgi:hypothetical protein
MKNACFWDVTPCSSCENHTVFLHSVLFLLVTASSLILVTLMMEAIPSTETSALTRATWHNIPEDSILFTDLYLMSTTLAHY